MRNKKFDKFVIEPMIYALAYSVIVFEVMRAYRDHQANKLNETRNNAARALKSGVWQNEETGAIYNCYGDRVGFLTYDWKFRSEEEA